MNSPLLDKSLDFSTQIVLFYETFSKSKKDTTIAKQLLRSETSIGANINEAVYGNSKADFISKLHISLNVELGKKNPTVEILSFVCDALDISLSDFFDDDTAKRITSDPLLNTIYRLNSEQREALNLFLNTLLK